MYVGSGRLVSAVLIVTTALAGWPTVVAGHGTAGAGGPPGETIPFLAAIGLSIAVGLCAGIVAVARYHPHGGPAIDRRSTMGLDVTLILIGLGIIALLSAVTSQPAPAVWAGLAGGALALLGRNHGVVSHHGCADVAFGAILAHRTVEGALVASIYAVDAALGFVGLALLTVHAVAETVAVGGLYAPLNRRWGIVSVVGVQLGFLLGAISGGILASVLSPTTGTALLAGVGGILIVAGSIEFRGAVGGGRFGIGT